MLQNRFDKDKDTGKCKSMQLPPILLCVCMDQWKDIKPHIYFYVISEPCDKKSMNHATPFLQATKDSPPRIT